MIDNIFGNKTNILVLRFMVRFSNQFFSADEIAKETGAGRRNAYDSLKFLVYENILTRKVSLGKILYRFISESRINESISQFFEEEKKKLFLKNISFYKLLSELESKITFIAASNITDILLFGSVAKGRDTASSDIDLCVLLARDDESMRKKIREISFDKKFKNEIHIHIFTTKDFLQASEKRNPLVWNIIRDGLSLKIGK